MIDAVVLAGAPNNGALSTCSQGKNEALIKINQHYMIEYVIHALSAVPQINNIYIVGIKDSQGENFNYLGERVYLIPGGNTIIENAICGIEQCKTEKVLISTSDIPLLTTEAVEDFLLDCYKEEEWDFYYPIVNKSIIQNKFNKVKRTYVKTREGIFTGGNIFLVRPAVIPPIVSKVQEFIDNRKSPLKLCSILGLKFIILFLLHRLTIAVVEKKVSLLAGIRAKAVVVKYPEIGIDVDKPSDLEIVSEYIKEKL